MDTSPTPSPRPPEPSSPRLPGTGPAPPEARISERARRLARAEARAEERARRIASDASLAARLRAGDERAYCELHERYHSRVIRFAARRLGDPAEAEDLAQDVFLQVYRSIDAYRGGSGLLTWILGIANHLICDRFRRRRLNARPLDDAVHRVPAPLPAADDTLDAVRALNRCAEVLRRLGPGQRRAFELRYWHAHSVESIARETGCSAGAVRIGLLRARRALGASLEATMPGLWA